MNLLPDTCNDESEDFIRADRQIEKLLNQLQAKKLCAGCVGWALLVNSTRLLKSILDSDGTAALLEGLARAMREKRTPTAPH